MVKYLPFLLALSGCVHTVYGRAPVFAEQGIIMDQEWVTSVARDRPDLLPAAQKAAKVPMRCSADLGTDSQGRAITGMTLAKKDILILCYDDIRKTALIHERNHLMLYHAGFSDWAGHSNALWPWLDSLEIESRSGGQNGNKEKETSKKITTQTSPRKTGTCAQR